MNKLSLTTLGIGTLLVSSNCTPPEKEIRNKLSGIINEYTRPGFYDD